MEFEWDELKNEANKRNHGISFETAAFVFNDDRYITIGKVRKVLYVVFTEREDKIRIISARLAEKKEKEIYYGNS